MIPRQSTYVALVTLILALQRAVHADDLLITSLSLDDYTSQAIQQGVQGRENSTTLEAAGYTREIAFRQTDSPTFSLVHEQSRSENWTSGVGDSVSSGHLSSLNGTEVTPLGTTLNGTSSYGPSNEPTLNASAVQPLYIFVHNAVLRERREADLAFANARDDYDAAVLAIRTQARSLYYDVMEDEESIGVEQRKVASSQKLQDVTEALVEAGRLPAVEKMRAKIRTQTDERQLENAIVTRDKAVLSAKNYIFYDLEQPLHFTTKLQFKPFDVPLDHLIDYALVHRPELKSLRRNKELALLNTQATQEATRPTITINAAYGSTEIPDVAISRNWNVGGTVNWLFFDSFVTADRVKIARIGEFVADLNLADAERTTRVDVRNAYLDVKRAEKQITDFQSSREQASQNVEVLRLRFKNGLEKLIDVFDAENDMRDLDNEYLGLLVSFNEAKDNLSELVGADVETIR